MRISIRISLIALAAAVMGLTQTGASRAEEYVSKEEFQQFKAEFEKFKVQNEQLKTENAELRTENKNFQTINKATPIGARLDQSVFSAAEQLRNDVNNVKSGTTKFLLTGSADVAYMDHAGNPSTFTSEFDPIYLWKMSDRLSFEAETPITVGSGGTSIELEYADIAYVVNDYLTVQAGKFKSPFGLFNMRFDPPWINKFSDAPAVYDDGAAGLVPHQELGVMGSGAIEAGPGKLKYNVFLSNGLRVETADPAAFGLFINNDQDNNKSKGVGGRLGYIPIPCLEIGFSGEFSSNVFDQGKQGDVSGRLLGADFSFIRDFDQLMGTIDFKAEWIWSKAGDATYMVNTNPVTTVVFNNNRRDGGYVQMAYRPIKFDQRWVKNLEFAVRYDHLSNPKPTADTPPDALFQRQNHDRYTVGLNYWLDASTVLKFDYERDSRDHRTIWLQYALGF